MSKSLLWLSAGSLVSLAFGLLAARFIAFGMASHYDPAFEKWMECARRIAIVDWGYDEASAAAMDPVKYRPYFDLGVTPEDAVREDVLHG